jgi:hypothetical protein
MAASQVVLGNHPRKRAGRFQPVAPGPPKSCQRVNTATAPLGDITVDVADMMAEAKFKISILLKTRAHQLVDERLGLRPSGRSDERLVG